MSPEAQRIAIAEACGTMKWSHALPEKTVHCDVPDYLNDLNAMHEAEKARWTGDLKRFHNDAAVYREWKEYEHLLRRNIHAEAKERAAAFVVVTGKWDDSK